MGKDARPRRGPELQRRSVWARVLILIHGGFSLVALCTAGLLARAFESGPAPVRLPMRIIGWFGRHSYELYLFHSIVLAAMRNAAPKGSLAYAYKLPCFALYVSLSVLAAGVISRYFSEPSNRALRRFMAASRHAEAGSLRPAPPRQR